jgi:uncharacterized RDD family membrane protein YckC
MSDSVPAAQGKMPEPDTTPEPGIYPGPSSSTGLRYWNGQEWDPRPVAHIWTRVWCNVIDSILASILWFILVASIVTQLPRSGTPDNDDVTSLISISTLVVAYVAYFAVAYRLWGRTPGMMLGRLHVIHIPTGQSKLTWGTALGRALGLVLGYACGIFALIWLVTTASSRTKQGPHDSWAHTGVLMDPPAGTVGPLLVSGSAATLAATRAPPATAVTTPPRAAEPPHAAPTTSAEKWATATPLTDEPTQPVAPTLVAPVSPTVAATPADDAAADPATQISVVPAPVVPPAFGAAAAPRRSKATGVIAGLVLVLLAGLGLVFVDSRVKANSLANLLVATEETQGIIWDYASDQRFHDLRAELTAAQTVPSLESAYYDQVWSTFIDGTRLAAGEYVVPLQRAILDVEAVDSLPWHDDIAEARDAYLDYAYVWMEAVSRRAQHTTSDRYVPTPQEGLDAEIDSTRTIAQRRIRDLVIFWMPSELDARIRRAF